MEAFFNLRGPLCGRNAGVIHVSQSTRSFLFPHLARGMHDMLRPPLQSIECLDAVEPMDDHNNSSSNRSVMVIMTVMITLVTFGIM